MTSNSLVASCQVAVAVLLLAPALAARATAPGSGDDIKVHPPIPAPQFETSIAIDPDDPAHIVCLSIQRNWPNRRVAYANQALRCLPSLRPDRGHTADQDPSP